MRARQLCFIIAALLLCSVLRPQESQLSLSRYIEELEYLQGALNAPQPGSANLRAITGGLPPAWAVRTDSQTFLVSSAELTKYLQEYQRDPRKTASLTNAVRLVAMLLADAKAMDASAVDAHAEQQRLDRILARNEFYSALHESWWERLKQEARFLFFRLLQGLLGSSDFPVIGRVLVWAIAALAISLIGWRAIRSYLRSEEFAYFSSATDAVSAKPWHQWQAEAKGAADQGRWRDAIHFSYWAAISFLEGEGLWRPDRARTPREYLRLLPRGDLHRDSLSELTQEFEKTWYGSEVATIDQFHAFDAILGRLGCR